MSDLRDLLVRAVSGDPWHGSSLLALIEDVTEEEARARPVAGAHSIAELVLHLAGWTDEVRQRLGGRAAQEPDAGDWPKAMSLKDARRRLLEAQEALLVALDALPAARLREPVNDRRDPALGTGMSLEATLYGLLQHHAYHGGQLGLLKRALRARA